MATSFRVGTVGKPIRLFVSTFDSTTGLRTPKDLSTAQVKQIKLIKPRGGEELTKVAQFVNPPGNGTDGGLEYTFVDGDLDKAGDWEAQAYYELTGGEKDHSTRATFSVAKNIGGGA